MTTPRAIKVLKIILKMPGVVVVRGSSYDNLANLSEKWRRRVLDPLAGTRLGRQEIEAEMLEDVPGALWNLAMIEALRVKPDKVPALKRVVVGVDPQGSKSSADDDREVETASGDSVHVGRHETGIVAAGRGVDGHYYVLEDASLNESPARWGAKAVAVYERRKADRIVAEKNFGGEMVELTIRTVSDVAAFAMVSASRGKRQRAEPVAALYEQGKVHHVGTFAALEDEQCSFTHDTTSSPNRMDALVWTITELMEEYGGGSAYLR